MNTLTVSDSAFFVSSSKLLIESLFHSPRTASGVFKVKKNGVLFLGGDGTPFAFLVANRFGERFFVSCSRNEKPKGIRYLYSLMDSDKLKLGLNGLGYMNELEVASRLWTEIKAEGKA